MDNLKAALAEADMDPSNIVRMNMYTTDVDAFMAAAEHLVPIFAGDERAQHFRATVDG